MSGTSTVKIGFVFLYGEGAGRIRRSEGLGNRRGQSQQGRIELGLVSAIDSEGRTSGLLMHIAATESVSLCVRRKS
jgi:hypothetical protein